uniref:Uncharacterized protein n=1 Tax=Myotis myotis TaxID=51298 RepID=A0A7J8AMT9_MYOMY|nr:hypothetical protein mMyoMyo1_008192 [Myotis myotis]
MGVATTPFRVLGVENFPIISAIPVPGSQTSFSSRRGHLLAAAYFQKDLSPAAWPVSFPTLHRSRERAEKWNGHRVSPAVATKRETAPESIEIASPACRPCLPLVLSLRSHGLLPSVDLIPRPHPSW